MLLHGIYLVSFHVTIKVNYILRLSFSLYELCTNCTGVHAQKQQKWAAHKYKIIMISIIVEKSHWFIHARRAIICIQNLVCSSCATSVARNRDVFSCARCCYHSRVHFFFVSSLSYAFCFNKLALKRQWKKIVARNLFPDTQTHTQQ